MQEHRTDIPDISFQSNDAVEVDDAEDAFEDPSLLSSIIVTHTITHARTRARRANNQQHRLPIGFHIQL